MISALRLLAAAILLCPLSGALSAQRAAALIEQDREFFIEMDSVAGLLWALEGKSPYMQLGKLQEDGIAEFEENVGHVRDFVSTFVDEEAALGFRFGLLKTPKLQMAFRCEQPLEEIARWIEERAGIEVERRRKSGAVHELVVPELGFLGRRGDFILYASEENELRGMRGVAPERSMAAVPGLERMRRDAGHLPIRGVLRREAFVKAKDLDALMKEQFLSSLVLEGLRGDIIGAEEVYFEVGLQPELRVALRSVGSATEDGWTNPEKPSQRIPTLEREGARIALDHDLATFWRLRESIIFPEALPSLAQFTQGLDTLLSGISTSEVAASLAPGLELIALDDYHAQSEDQLSLPSIAIAVNLAEDREPWLEDRLRVAFQTTIGGLNLQAGQDRRRPYLLYSRQVGEVEILATRLVGSSTPGYRGMAENFEPAFVILGSKVVLCSNLRTAEEIARATRDARSRQDLENEIRIQGRAVAAFLTTNRKTLENESILEEGLTLDEARDELDTAIDLLRSLKSLHFQRRLWSRGALWDLRLGFEDER